MQEVTISYDSHTNSGILINTGSSSAGGWRRLLSSALNYDVNSSSDNKRIRLPWHHTLNIIREYSPLQRQLDFKFVTDESSKDQVNKFVREVKATSSARNNEIQLLTKVDIQSRLTKLGFTKRDLREFQIRDVAKLASIPNGANFSVPGAGKTTVTLAIHLISCRKEDKLLVICPKSAFPAWDEIIEDCIEPKDGWPFEINKFINLSKVTERVLQTLLTNRENKFFVTNYEHFVSNRDTFAFILATTPIHLVLDESHRMKAGQLSQRGAALLSVANLPIRKDILTGTPMPQSRADLQAQLDFLWAGSSLGNRIQRGEKPADVISGIYTRTTKEELGLPPINRKFVQVPMTNAQAALYGIVRNETLRQLSSFGNHGGLDIMKARRSVMRLLQLGSNPILAVRGISEDIFIRDHALLNAIIHDPISPKIEEVCRLVRLNVKEGRKTVVWTIFTQNIIDLERQLSDLNPVSLYGDVATGDSGDDATREGRLLKFHVDPGCWVMIANPAAAGEGISLHQVCHEAIYLDRSYVSTHYLQSIDRIHRLGLNPKEVTNVTIVQIAAPIGLGSIDYSVSRRLARKIRELEQLLNDRDLHQIALDEENALEPVDYALDNEDIVDLIAELEGNSTFEEEGI